MSKSAFHCAVASGYEPPVNMPDHPADVAGQRWESNFVLVKREAKVSWQNIARMVGKTEPELRREYEAYTG